MAQRQPSTSGSAGKRKIDNKLVSSSTMSRADKHFIQDLVVKPRVPSTHGNSKSPCWNHIGYIHSISQQINIEENRLFCSPCLESEKTKGAKGHISKVASFSTSTSTGTMALHLSVKHSIREDSSAKSEKILGYLQKYSKTDQTGACGSMSLSDHELNRHLVIWFCRDLIPFDAVQKDGMKEFFDRILPSLNLPTPVTLSNSALDDVYMSLRSQVQNMMKDCKSLCLMFDGWTDKYRARSYMGIRASVIYNWSYTVVTLGCHVLPSHTGREIADFVLKVLGEFVPDVKKVFLTTCHDGAANMIKASQLLKTENFQHCTAHAIHLLLTVDSFSKVDEATALLQKCRDIVTCLHFKSTLIEEELALTEDKIVIDNFRKKISDVTELLDKDDQHPIVEDNTPSPNTEQHHHISLKASCPTRWNSTLYMIDSIVDMKREAMNALKRIGKADMCLDTDEIELLIEMKNFLKPFESFTGLVSTQNATLSLVPLIKLQIRKLCNINVAIDSLVMQTIKNKIRDKLDQRMPESKAMKIHRILDPSTKDVMPRDDAMSELQAAVQMLIQRGLIISPRVQLQGQSNENAQEVDDVDADAKCKVRKLKEELLQELLNAGPSDISEMNEVSCEISNYMSSRFNVSDVGDDIIEFWQGKVTTFPILAQLALIYLPMSSSSVLVEQMFSTTGLICNYKRCMLGEDKVNRISFIHDNFKFI